jgi:putative ABC transport system permease protein
MTGVPVGRRNLFAERRRAALGIAGVAVAFLLILILDGVVNGATRQLTRYIDTSPAAVFVAQHGVTNMHMASSALPLTDVEEIRAFPGVTWADPILYAPDALASHDGRELAYVVGYRPNGHGGPTRLTAGHEPAPGQIVIDRQAATRLRIGVGEQVRVLGRTWQVSGITTGLTNIANTVAFVRFDEFAAARQVPGTTSYVLVGSTGSPDLLARRIEAATALTALSKARFAAQEAALARDMTTQILQIVTLAAFLIGMSVIGLTLYTATLSRLREIGIMKALGARPGRLAAFVLAQATWTIAAALTVAVALDLLLAFALPRVVGGDLPISLDASSIARAAVTGAVLGALGAIASLVKVWRVDPASVFRR